MIKEIQLRVSLKEESQRDILLKKASQYLSIPKADITGVKILRKSIDARKPKIIFNYKVAVYIEEPLPKYSEYTFEYKDVSNAKPIHIIGFGPAGMYAALRCIELGYKPIVLERGKNVQDRRRDCRWHLVPDGPSGYDPAHWHARAPCDGSDPGRHPFGNMPENWHRIVGARHPRLRLSKVEI